MTVRGTLAALLVGGGVGIVLAASAVKVPYPQGYRSWFHVKSMVVVSDAHPLHASFGGVHHVYVNDLGRKALASGGPYADGTVFVFDLLEANQEGGAWVEGPRKLVGVMMKSPGHFAATGGWGFEAFEGDSPSARRVTDAATQCWSCHQPARDAVFSQYRK